MGGVVAVCSCCFGCMWGAYACFMAAQWVVFLSDVHCVMVSVEMDARDCGLDSVFACVLLGLLACLTCRLQLLLFGSQM